MREVLVAAVELLAYLVATGVLAGAGLFAELASVSYVSGGNVKFAIWLALIGAVALYAAFAFGTDRLLPQLRSLRG
jgi:hypothetical protein